MAFELEQVIPPLPRVVRGNSVALGADPRGNILLYPNGNSVILRNIKQTTKNDVYTQHSVAVQCANYCPSGFYIASADKTGKIRIWDTINPEHILKNEYQPFVGPVNGIAWSPDNTKIAVGGMGGSKFGAVINAETGTNVGEIMGVSRNVNTVAYRPVRPFRVVLGTDDGLVAFFHGPPFVFKTSHSGHASFVNVICYSPSGSIFVSVGSDAKILIYDGETGDMVGEPEGSKHSGGIYGACFSNDGSRFVTASADKSLKLWTVDGNKLDFLTQYTFDSMLFGCLWMDDTIAAVTLDGAIHLFDSPPSLDTLGAPKLVFRGHSINITCGIYSAKHQCLITASSDTTMALWNMTDGNASMLGGKEAHTSKIQDIAVIDDHILSIGFDDRCVLSNLIDKIPVTSIKLPSQPHAIGVIPGIMLAVVACEEHMILLKVSVGQLIKVDEQAVSLGSCSMSVSPTTGFAIVCCANERLFAYKTFSEKLCETTLTNPPKNPQLLVSFSNDGSMVAFVGVDRLITVHAVEDAPGDEVVPKLQNACKEWWKKHTARLTALGWSPNGRRLATGSLDTCITVWSLDNPQSPVFIQGAHPMSNSTSLSWADNQTLISTANDGTIRRWRIP